MAAHSFIHISNLLHLKTITFYYQRAVTAAAPEHAGSPGTRPNVYEKILTHEIVSGLLSFNFLEAE